jgi:hypothetical protein
MNNHSGASLNEHPDSNPGTSTIFVAVHVIPINRSSQKPIAFCEFMDAKPFDRRHLMEKI